MTTPHSQIMKTVCLVVIAAICLWGCSRTQTDLPVQAVTPVQAAILPPAMDASWEDISPQKDDVDLPTPELRPMIHKVKWARETLFSISQWYTGSGNNWRRLVEANPNINPRRIHIGNTILIPNELLKTRRPMPADHIRPKSVKKQPTPRRRPKPTPKVHAPPLYGPIHGAAQSETQQNTTLPVPLETID